MHGRLALATVAALAATVVAVQAASAAPRSTSAKALVFCSDISYPPEEYVVNGKPVGSDIDIGKNVAKRLGMVAQFANTGFDGIIAALLSNKCDAIISGMNDTPQRAKSVAFVDYLDVGQSFIGKKGNPLKIKTELDVCGKVAGAQVATTNLQTLQAVDKKCKAKGKKGVSIISFKEDPLGVTALKTGKIDVYESDSPPAVWYTSKDKSLQIVGPPVNAIPVGIAVNPKNTSLKAGIRKAITAMYKDGTMKRILAKWRMTQFALKGK
jgi:polar amino acid transport system substrate-binding protein